MTSPLAIGTRGSALALAQAALVARALTAVGQESLIVVVETAGDRREPDTAWGEGAFVVAIERALLGGRVDLAVHSAKDVPTEEDPRLHVAAYLPRADARDALVLASDTPATTLDDLPPGSRVGTDSPRRTGFVLGRRPDLQLHPLYGNVDTRLRRLDAHDTDALILACAGLDRLGMGDRISERIAADILPPAAGQGAIAVQARSDDDRVRPILAEIDDRTTRLAVTTERRFLRACGGGCRSPIGALATVHAERLTLRGGWVGADGTNARSGRVEGPSAEGDALALRLAHAIGAIRAVDANSTDGRVVGEPAR